MCGTFLKKKKKYCWEVLGAMENADIFAFQIQVLTSKISKGGKEARLKEGEGGGRGGVKGMAL